MPGSAEAVRQWPSLAPIYVLAPPYDALTPVCGTPSGTPEIGTVLCADGSRGEAETLSGLAFLVFARLRWPWVVPCLFHPRGMMWLETIVVGFPQGPCILGREGIAPSVPIRTQRVLRAVDRRSVPPPEVLARFVGLRTHCNDLIDLLSQQFSYVMTPAVEPIRSSSYYSRRLAPLSGWNARDWRIVARMALRAAGWTGGDSTNPRTWGTRARRYLGCSWDLARQLHGWESILELATRAHGPCGTVCVPHGKLTAGTGQAAI